MHFYRTEVYRIIIPFLQTDKEKERKEKGTSMYASLAMINDH